MREQRRMGYGERASREKYLYNRTRPMRFMKAIIAMILGPILLPIYMAKAAYKENEWVWEIFKNGE